MSKTPQQASKPQQAQGDNLALTAAEESAADRAWHRIGGDYYEGFAAHYNGQPLDLTQSPGWQNGWRDREKHYGQKTTIPKQASAVPDAPLKPTGR